MEEAIYSKIDSEVKRRAETYIYESKMVKKVETDNLRKLIELSIDGYIIANPINAQK
jgi:hypothetical protein